MVLTHIWTNNGPNSNTDRSWFEYRGQRGGMSLDEKKNSGRDF
ncbi:hypothetical protein SLEP1_g56108 [Rubroshorea leprosula]|uniref:Uncharacterized protein n=1 Tax=Rubroshorea leprosula TaxID=152421 RepID=A0AAV5MKI6_9ROSI|nr:hypothetical protein SLEP1_g56108 [Rubroshorea leprosula]